MNGDSQEWGNLKWNFQDQVFPELNEWMFVSFHIYVNVQEGLMTINNHQIDMSDYVRFLGVLIESQLTSKKHMTYKLLFD